MTAARGWPEFLRLLPQHLTVAWSATAVLYLSFSRHLPEPATALIAATLTAIGGAALSVPTTPTVATADPLITAPVHYRVESAAAVVPSATTPGASDIAAYPPAADDEVQCPACGGFAVDRHASDADLSVTCRTCRTTWPVGPDHPRPDVVIRSWLHR